MFQVFIFPKEGKHFEYVILSERIYDVLKWVANKEYIEIDSLSYICSECKDVVFVKKSNNWEEHRLN